MIKDCCLVFDIGKTNQKYFLFDKDLRILKHEKVTLPKTKDEDKHTAENIQAIVKWMKKNFEALLNSNIFKIKSVNFSGFGATLVHLNKNGEVIAPVYDYHKKVEDEIFISFYKKYGPESVFSCQTGSKNLNLLNSGKQLYWLKYKRPETFKKIRFTLHLPQYLSFVFTGDMFSEYTSIGCHTDLWDYQKKEYHFWVKAEGIDRLFPKIYPTQTKVVKKYRGQRISFGIGIHDSSSALLSILLKEKETFLLLSTGTWCINFNPSSKDLLFNSNQIASGATTYMKIDGNPVKTSRLFMGEEHRIKLGELIQHFKKTNKNYIDDSVNKELVVYLSKKSKNHFHWKYLDNTNSPDKDNLEFPNFETAYYRLIKELIGLLKVEINVICKKIPKKLYVDGGFSSNKIFLAFLEKEFPDQLIKAKPVSSACAMGAAMLIDL